MTVDEMIAKLTELRSVYGNVEVLITDGHQANCYRGQYEIIAWDEDNGQMCIDIGIGGCLE